MNEVNVIYLIAGILGGFIGPISFTYAVVVSLKEKKRQEIEEDRLNKEKQAFVLRDESLMRDKRYFRIKEKKESLSESSVYLDVKLKTYIFLLEKEKEGTIYSTEVKLIEFELHEYLMIFTNKFEAFLDEVDHFCLRYKDWILQSKSDTDLANEIKETLVKFIEFIDKIQCSMDDLYRPLMGKRAPRYILHSYRSYYQVLKKLNKCGYKTNQFIEYNNIRLNRGESALF